jgi:flagellar motor switch protein FliG
MAGTLMMLIGEESASNVFKYLNEAEIEKISRQIALNGPASGDDAEQQAEELYRAFFANPLAMEGGASYARRIIMRSLEPGTARRILDRLGPADSSRSSGGFETIDQMNPQQLSQLLQNEHPQTTATILAHVTPGTAAAVLALLPDALKVDVAARMVNMDAISSDIVFSLSSSLNEKLKSVASAAPEASSHGGARAVAEVFNRLDRKTSQAVLQQMETSKPEVAESIRQVMFIFEDIATLDAAAVRSILQQADKKVMAQALMGATESLQQTFFRNMSQRATEMMKEEMETMAALKPKEIHQARQKVIEIVRKLEEEGVISIGNGDEG